MAKPEFIARQSAHPTGRLGHVVARVMALETVSANRPMLDRLDPKPGLGSIHTFGEEAAR